MKLTGLCKNLRPGKCLELAKSRNLRQIGIFVGVCVILSPLIIYCLIQIINAYRLYRMNQDSLDELAPSKQLGVSIMDRSNDNADDYETNVNDEQLIDEYESITKTIQQSFSGYKDYNKRIENYYKERQLEGKPDMMDPSVLNRNNDDW